HDLHNLAGLADDGAAGAVAPAACGVENRQPVGEARHDLAVEETRPFRFAHAEPMADVAAEHELRHLGRVLAAEAIEKLRAGAAGERERKQQRRSGAQQSYPLMRSMAAPQAESLSSNRSKPRSR